MGPRALRKGKTINSKHRVSAGAAKSAANTLPSVRLSFRCAGSSLSRCLLVSCVCVCMCVLMCVCMCVLMCVCMCVLMCVGVRCVCVCIIRTHINTHCDHHTPPSRWSLSDAHSAGYRLHWVCDLVCVRQRQLGTPGQSDFLLLLWGWHSPLPPASSVLVKISQK